MASYIPLTNNTYYKFLILRYQTLVVVYKDVGMNYRKYNFILKQNIKPMAK